MINILEEDIVLNPQLFLDRLMAFLQLRQEDLEMHTLNTIYFCQAFYKS